MSEIKVFIIEEPNGGHKYCFYGADNYWQGNSFAFNEYPLKISNGLNNPTQIDELTFIQLLGKKLVYNEGTIFTDQYPPGYKDLFPNPNRSFKRNLITSPSLRSLSALNLKYISASLFYSKELVLALAVSEAALRSKYPDEIVKKPERFVCIIEISLKL